MSKFMLLICHKYNGNHVFYFQYRNLIHVPLTADHVPLTFSKQLILALNVENAAEVLIFAYVHENDELKREAMKYINK